MRIKTVAGNLTLGLLLSLAIILGIPYFDTARQETEAPDSRKHPSTPLIEFKVTATYPHDSNAFTQGLVFSDNVLYEGTGVLGQSSLRKVEYQTGRVLAIHRMPANYFGEGIASIDARIYQLTWKSRVGFIYDKATLYLQRRFRYDTEGWGLTYDGRYLVRSDGSSLLRFHDPETFAVVRQLEVRDPAGPVTRLNELEFVGNAIYANVWKTNRIVKISPATGAVLGEIDLSVLVNELQLSGNRSEANGIAYDAKRNRFFVTGKLWPKLFEIVLLD